MKNDKLDIVTVIEAANDNLPFSNSLWQLIKNYIKFIDLHNDEKILD